MKKISKQITLGYDPITGKRIRIRIYADSKAGLRQAEKDAIREYAKKGRPSHILYQDYEKKWFDAYCSHTQPHTQAGYWTILNKNKPLYGKKLKDITRTDLQKIINDHWDSPSVCIRYAQIMKRIFASAIDDDLCQKNVALNLSVPKAVKTVRRPLTEEELTAISKAEFDPSERFMMDVLLQFGLRPQEAYALNKQSFNRKARTLTIDKALAWDHNQPIIKSTKTGVTRVLPVPDSFWSRIPETKTMYYFTEDNGQLLRHHKADDFARGILKKINEAMGGTDKLKVTDMTLYNCRHHKASLLYYLPGISVKKKAQYMGHSEKMFLQTYSHMMEDKEDSEVLRQAVSL